MLFRLLQKGKFIFSSAFPNVLEVHTSTPSETRLFCVNFTLNPRAKILDVWFSQQVSIRGPPVDFWYVRNERLRMTNNYFHCKNNAHQLIFLPLDLGENLRKTTLF